MTDYTDLPEVNQLYAQREQVTQASAILEGGGAVTNISVTPGPDQTMPTMMGASVPLPPPTSQATVAQVLNVLRERLRQIDARLKELGVTTPPVLEAKPAKAATR